MESVSNLFDDLYSQYANKLQKYAERILHNPETAEDVVQDTFIVLLSSRLQFLHLIQMGRDSLHIDRGDNRR